jgi:hypothetical protein
LFLGASPDWKDTEVIGIAIDKFSPMLASFRDDLDWAFTSETRVVAGIVLRLQRFHGQKESFMHVTRSLPSLPRSGT